MGSKDDSSSSDITATPSADEQAALDPEETESSEDELAAADDAEDEESEADDSDGDDEDPPEEPPDEGGGDPPGEEPPKTWLQRFDRWFYDLESGIVSGALIVMSMTYVLKIIDRDMQAATTAFDKFFLKIAGYSKIGDAPKELVESISSLWSPLILTVSCYLLCVLALRTRQVIGGRGDDAEDRPPPTPADLKRWLLLALPATLAVYLSLKLVEVVPAKYLCTFALLAMVLAALKGAGWLPAGLDRRGGGVWLLLGFGPFRIRIPLVIPKAKTSSLLLAVQPQAPPRPEGMPDGRTIGVLIGGVLLTWFFWTQAESDYIWNDKLSLVLLMYVGFFGASMATKTEQHIKIDAVRKVVPRGGLHVYNSIGNVLTVLFLVFLEILAVQFTIEIGLVNQIEGLGLGYYLITLPIVISFAVMIVRFTAITVRDLSAWRRGELPPELTPGAH